MISFVAKEAFNLGMLTLIPQMAILTFGRLVGAGCVFLVTLVLARFFDVNSLANYSLLLSIAGILSVLLPLGFHAIATLFAAEYQAIGKHQELKAFRHYADRLTSLTTLATAPIAIAGAGLLPEHNGYDVLALALLSVPMAFAMANIYLNSALLIGLEHHYWAHLPDMVVRPALLLAGLGILIINGSQASHNVLFFVMLAATLTMLLQRIAVHRLLPSVPSEVLSIDILQKEKKRWWDLAPSHMKITLLWDYFFEIHLLIASFFSTPDMVATLFVCFRIRQLAGFGIRSLYSLLMPKVIAANAIDDKTKAQTLLNQAVRLTFYYAAALWLIMAVVGEYILGAFGSAFSGQKLILLMLMGTMVIRSIYGPAATVLGMYRHADVVIQLLLGSLVLSLAITFAGIALFPELAIPVAYLVSTSFSAIAIWRIARKRTGLDTAVWG